MNLIERIIVACVLFIFFQSCEDGNYETSYFSDGKIHMKYEITNGKRNGKCTEYYQNNGEIASTTNWLNDTLNGIAAYYYETGELRESCFWIKGELQGSFRRYYKNGEIEMSGNYYKGKHLGDVRFYKQDGKLETIRKYVLLEDNEIYLNEVIFFMENGDTNYAKSNFFEIRTKRDTILLGDYFNAQIILKAPYFRNSEMFVYVDIENDSSLLRRFHSKNFKVNYEYLPSDTGLNKLTGVIEEYIILGDTVAKGKARYMYFDYSYYVTPPPLISAP